MWSKEKILRYLCTFVLAIVLILAAVVLESALNISPQQSVWHDPHTWVSFLNEIGFAFLIALVIMLAIEQGARDEFNKTVDRRIAEVQQNVFRSTFGGNIPKGLIDEVENLVLRADFVRRDHRATYRLKIQYARDIDPNTENDFRVAIVDVTTSYVVKNVSGVKKDYTVRLELEKPPVDGLAEVVRIESVKINNVELGNVKINEGDQSAPDTTEFKRFSHTIPAIAPGTEAEVVTKCTQVKLLDDVEIWRSLIPGERMSLTVYLPADQTKRFGAHALHRQELIHRVDDLAAGYHEWVLDGAVLPHQGIVFWWRCSDLPA